MLRFLLELYKRSEHLPEIALPYLSDSLTTNHVVQKIDCSPEPSGSTYWKRWGGTYNNPSSVIISVFLGVYLELVNTLLEIESLSLTMFRDTDFVLINPGDKYAWQYPKWQTEISVVEGYASAAKSETNPSDDKYDGRRYPTRFAVPTIQNKLSDIIRGTALQNSTFSVTVYNDDGLFDQSEQRNFFNTPVYILKSDKKSPSYSDYVIVRRGYIDDPEIGPEEVTFKCATLFRSFTADACRAITEEEFPNAGDNIDKLMPILWGTVFVSPIKVDDGTYLVCDPDYLGSIDAVYDSDGVEITAYSTDGNLVIMDDVDEVPNDVKVTGSLSNDIGSIITSEIQKKGFILYSSGSWDTTETNSYISSAPELDLLITSGTLKDVITKCLESDAAYLIEKSGGRLSIRKWGSSYTSHSFSGWQFTQRPEKTYLENKYYASSVRVLYRDSPSREDDDRLVALDSSNEKRALEAYRKSETKEFETNLTSQADAVALASLLAGRFSRRPEVFTFAFGFDLSSISILDTIQMTVSYNGRAVSSATEWVVLDIDLGQDTVTVEEKTT